MLKTVKQILILILFIMLYPTQALALEEVDLNKNWKVTFNTLIDQESVNEETVYVLDENGENKRVIYDFTTKELNGEEVTVLTVDPITIYSVGDYILHITKGVKGENGIAIKSEISHEFTTQTDKAYQAMSLEELKENYESVIVTTREEYGGRTMGFWEKDLLEEYYYLRIRTGHDYGEPTRGFLQNEFGPTIYGVDHYEGRYPRFEIVSYDGMAVRDSPIWDQSIFDTFINRYGVDQSEIKYWLLENPEQENQFVVDIATHSEHFATYLKEDVGLGSSSHYMDDDTLMVSPMEVLGAAKGVVTTKENNRLLIEYNGKALVLKPNSKEALFEEQPITLNKPTQERNGNIFINFQELASIYEWDVRESRTFGRFQVGNYELEISEGTEDNNEYIQENIRK